MIRLRLWGGVELRLGADFFGVLCLSWELGGAGEGAAWAILWAVLIHEGGHLLAYRLGGIPVRLCTFDYRGICIRPRQGFYPFWAELGAVCAGSGFSFLWAALAYLTPLPPVFWQSSLVMGVWSLLPLKGMDGGEIAALIAGRLWPGCEGGLRVFFLVTRAAVTILIVAGCIALQSVLPLFWAVCLWM